MNNKLNFNKELTDYELNYWSVLLQELPTNCNNYINNAYEIWDNTHPFKEIRANKAIEHLELASTCKNVDELLEKLSKDVDVISHNTKYKKAFNAYLKIFPDFNPSQLMFTTIYFSSLIDVNIKIEKDGIKLLSIDSPESKDLTYAPQISAIADLMNGRIFELDKSYKGSEIEVFGSVQLNPTDDKNVHHIEITYAKKSEINNKLQPTVIVNKTTNYLSMFSIDFSGENFDSDLILSPLGNFQSTFVKALPKINLENELGKSKNTTKRAKI